MHPDYNVHPDPVCPLPWTPSPCPSRSQRPQGRRLLCPTASCLTPAPASSTSCMCYCNCCYPSALRPLLPGSLQLLLPINLTFYPFSIRMTPPLRSNCVCRDCCSLRGQAGMATGQRIDLWTRALRRTPHCAYFFPLCSLPKYTDKTILRDKLLYAIRHAATMQADFRMRDGEGFEDV